MNKFVHGIFVQGISLVIVGCLFMLIGYGIAVSKVMVIMGGAEAIVSGFLYWYERRKRN